MKTKPAYNADSIEVLTGLEPVQKRPGMYTDVSRPNHLVQELIDNSVDEALECFVTAIHVTLHKDGYISVVDNGRGMPVDIHPTHKASGLEIILTKLHAGAKFSNKNYKFSGGLHGVGVSVVNALASDLQAQVKRDGYQYSMQFADGEKVSNLAKKKLPTTDSKLTGTSVKFLPNPKYFDSQNINCNKLKKLLKAKAVLCSGLAIHWLDETTNEQESWLYRDGITSYLLFLPFLILQSALMQSQH